MSPSRGRSLICPRPLAGTCRDLWLGGAAQLLLAQLSAERDATKVRSAPPDAAPALTLSSALTLSLSALSICLHAAPGFTQLRPSHPSCRRARQSSSRRRRRSLNKQLIVAAKEAELAEALKSERTKDEQLAETQRRFDKVAEHLKVAREELKLRSEQQRPPTSGCAMRRALRARGRSSHSRARCRRHTGARRGGGRAARDEHGARTRPGAARRHARAPRAALTGGADRARSRATSGRRGQEREGKRRYSRHRWGRTRHAPHERHAPIALTTARLFSPRHPSPSLFLILAGSERPESARRCWREGEGGVTGGCTCSGCSSSERSSYARLVSSSRRHRASSPS